jgi:hypothetical protein
VPKAVTAVDLRELFETFVLHAKAPALIDAGHDPLPLASGEYALTQASGRLTVECWSGKQTLVRRIIDVHLQRTGKVEFITQQFAGRRGRLSLVDLEHPAHADATRRSGRLTFREQFRLHLQRQYPDWRVAEISTEPNLQHTFSPTYPRALLRKGSLGMAAIGAPTDAADVDAALTFGLIWLAYLRTREPRVSITGLILMLPLGRELNTCHRVRHLDPKRAQVAVFVHGPSFEEAVDVRDYTNFATQLDTQATPSSAASDWIARLSAEEGVQATTQPDGETHFRLRGVEFARTAGSKLLYGLDHKEPGSLPHVQAFARQVARWRSPRARLRNHPLYLRHPEAWLEAQIRDGLQTIDGTLLQRPVYRQVFHTAATETGLTDLLAVDFEGRLVIIEVKAAEDVQLPLQALDYWMRISWHLERGDLARARYFPGIKLRPVPPRILLIAPAIAFHPTNEIVLGMLAPEIDVERIGLALDWRQQVKVVLRQTLPRCR